MANNVLNLIKDKYFDHVVTCVSTDEIFVNQRMSNVEKLFCVRKKASTVHFVVVNH